MIGDNGISRTNKYMADNQKQSPHNRLEHYQGLSAGTSNIQGH